MMKKLFLTFIVSSMGLGLVYANDPPIVNAGPDQAIDVPYGCQIEDRIIDQEDFDVWFAARFTQPGDPNWNPIADMNRDGIVDGSDFNIWNAAKFTTPSHPRWDPRADIGGPFSTQIQLQGTATDDGLPNPPGQTESTWSLLDGPTSVNISAPTQLNTNVTFAAAGTYTFLLSVTDGELTSSDTVRVDILQTVGPNQPPVVDAGPDQTINIIIIGTTATVQLNGSGTDDCLPLIPRMLSFRWSFVSGPGVVSFEDVTNPTTKVFVREPGEYILQLEATDGELTSVDNITITIIESNGNQPPTVTISGDTQLTVNEVGTYAVQITDDGFAPIVISWSVANGPGVVSFGSPTQATTTASFSTPGTYILQATIQDGPYTVIKMISVNVVAAPSGQSDILPIDKNVFSPTTGQNGDINFIVPAGGADVEVTVYSINSEKVRTIASGPLNPGVQKVTWDGRNSAGDFVATGTYPVVIKFGNRVHDKKRVFVISK